MAIERSIWSRTCAGVLSRPVDLASLAFFRILFGILMAAAMARFVAKGWVQELYVQPAYHFTYPGFEWVRPWSGPFMHLHFVLLGLLALGVALGWCYRLCIVLFFLGFTYVELLDQTTYLNHYYLISLMSGLLIFMPAHRLWSIDTWRHPKEASAVAPSWMLNLFRLQVAVVYVYAGLAKLNADWLLHAQPLRIWLAARSDLIFIGPWLAEPWVAYAASWFGAVFDVTIVFFLCWRTTRPWAYGVVIIFHVATAALFNIGMFPWIMMVAATIFFAPDWPRDFLRRLSGWAGPLCRSWRWMENLSALQASAGETKLSKLQFTEPNARWCWGVALPFGLYALVQIILPLRPYCAAQPPAWSGVGFNCAWQVMIVEKTGYAEFFAVDPPSGLRWKLRVSDYLTRRQEVMMSQDPQLIRALARQMAADLRAKGYSKIEIKVDAFATLNGRPSQRLIDPTIDLARAVGRDWIIPLRS